MAYATLLSITQTLEFILNPHHDQPPIRHQKLIKSLHEKFGFLLSFMEENFAHTKSETMTRLEKRIREMAYKAVHKIESQVLGGSHLKSKDLQKIMEQVDSISAEVAKMKDLNVTKNHPPTKFSPAGLSKSDHVGKSPIVGFRDELLAIKERLFLPPPELAIISIVGMGGIGKTTLARTIFDDLKIVSHFDARGWLTVSQNYHVQDMLRRLLKSIGRNDTEEVENLGQSPNKSLEKKGDLDLGQSLYKSLKQKRYLFVIDDVWDIKAWDSIKRFFPRDNIGSRIILTTRLLDVAVDANSSSPIYRPSLLSLDNSWKLLRQKVFGKESCPSKLEKIGKEIAKNCKGLPLALAVIGGLLSRGDRKLGYWEYIQQNIDSALANADDDFVEILALSYYQLPHQLRACFLYMGVFPEDYEVPKSKLINLWVAEGFLKPHASKSLEEVAHEYLQDLIDRNMILVREWNTIGGIKSCGIHDLVRDLCARITQEEKFLRITCERLPMPVRLGRGYGYSASIPSDNPDYRKGVYGSQARSFLCFDGTSRFDPLFSFILSFQQPRVLHALGDFSELPFDIANLRFLAVTKWEQFNLNESVPKLMHLQTLIIDSSITLPVEIWNMPGLKHIYTEECFIPYPSGAKKGTNFILSKNLQTLKGVKNSSSTKDVLKLVPNLKKLKIIFHGVTGTKLNSYVSKYFIHLDQLKHLYCLFEDTHGTEYQQPLVENFRLPSGLSKFTLDCCSLSSKTMAIIGSLPNLQVLNVRECHFVKKVWEPTEGEFDQLKSLLLDTTDLKHLKADETSFPNLECLRIFLCFELKRIPSPIGDIPTLQLIELDQSSESAEKSVLRIREEQEDMGNENLKIIFQKPYVDVDEDEDEEEDNQDDEESENEEDTEDEENDDDGEEDDDNEEDDEDDEEDNEDDRKGDDDDEDDEESSEDERKYKNDSGDRDKEKDDYEEDEEDKDDDGEDEENDEDEDDDLEDKHNHEDDDGDEDEDQDDDEDDEEDAEDSDNDSDDSDEDKVDDDDEEDHKKDEKRMTRIVKRTR